MRFKMYDVLTSRTYQTTNEGKRTVWYKVGEYKRTENGAQYLRLYANPELEYVLNERVPEVGELPTIE